MNRRWTRPPGGERTWDAGFFLLAGLVGVGIGLRRFNPILLALAVPTLVAGVGLWRRAPWGRLVAVATVAAALGVMGVTIALRGLTFWRGISVPAMAFFAWQLWRDNRPTPEDDDGKPLISFALLLSQPRFLEAPILAKVVSAAWGGDYAGIGSESDLDESTDREGDPSRFVAGESPLFIVQSPAGMFLVHNFDQPYFTDAGTMSATLKDRRLAHAVGKNAAWIAVDAMRAHHPEATPESLYPQVGRLIAELAGPDCLAIYQPRTGRLLAWDPSLEEKLKGPECSEALAETVLVPVVDVDGDAPSMKTAVAEARRRFPEFRDAFQRKDGEDFAIKAPVTRGGRTEYIWIHVEGLEPEFIHGVLGNNPVDLGGLKLGDRVEVPVADLNDWTYSKDGKWLGMFTMNAVMGK